MSKFHASVRDLLEDVNRFLTESIQNEVISSSSLAHKERLLSRLKSLQNEYPELQLNFNDDGAQISSTVPPSSPLPYVDMNGGSPYKIPFFPVNVDKDNYDVCSSKTKYDSVESQSVTESEDYGSEDARSLPEIAASDLYACEKSGYLDKKKRESIKGWLNPFQKRWCAIKDGVLYYYEKTTDRKQKGSIILSGYEVRSLPEDNKDGRKYNHCFELVCPGRRTYQFSAPSEKDLHQWIAAVENNSQLSNSGKISNRESQPLPNVPKDAPCETSLSDSEDIYEIVDEDDSKVKTKEQDLDSNGNEGSFTASSEEEVNQNQILNYHEWYMGLWDCSGADDTELSFYRGDLIRVISKEYDNFAWWIGEIQGKVGFVPKSYLMEAYEVC